MSRIGFALRPLLSLLFVLPLWAQQPDRGPGLLQQSATAQWGSTPVETVSMRGTVTLNAGGKAESGTVTLTATAAGQSQIVVELPSGRSTVTRDYSVTPRTGSHQGPDGVQTAESAEELQGPHPAWFYPAFIAAASTSPDYRVSYWAEHTRDGTAAGYVAMWAANARLLHGARVTFPLSPAPATGPEYEGQQELHLDPASGLPVSLTFKTRGYKLDKDGKPQVNAPPVLVPAEIRYSDYQQVDGRQVATRVQLLVNGGQTADIHIGAVDFGQGAGPGH